MSQRDKLTRIETAFVEILDYLRSDLCREDDFRKVGELVSALDHLSALAGGESDWLVMMDAITGFALLHGWQPPAVLALVH